MTIRKVCCVLAIIVSSQSAGWRAFAQEKGGIQETVEYGCWVEIEDKNCEDLYGSLASISGSCEETWGCTGAHVCLAYHVGVGHAKTTEQAWEFDVKQARVANPGEVGKDTLTTNQHWCYSQFACDPTCDFDFMLNVDVCLTDFNTETPYNITNQMLSGAACE